MGAELSVVITIHNLEEYLAGCIDSVLTQTYIPQEIILVDDGSTDRSADICRIYTEKHLFINYIRTEKNGSAGARKAGTLQANSEYIAYIDGDDIVDPKMYESYMEQVRLYHPDAVIGWITKDFENSSIVVKDRITPGVYEGHNYDELIRRMIDCGPFSESGIHASLCSKVFRKAAVEPYIYDVDERIVFGEDAAVLYPFLLGSKKICVTELTGYHWVQRKNSKTHKKDRFYLSELNYLEDYMRDKIPESILFRFMLNQIQNALQREYGFCDQYMIKSKNGLNDEPLYLFPFERIEKGSRVIIYGNGVVGQSFYRQIKHSDYCDVVAVADARSFADTEYDVITPSEISKMEYDKVVISVLRKDIALEIRNTLKNERISEDKIVWQDYRA